VRSSPTSLMSVASTVKEGLELVVVHFDVARASCA